MNIIFTVTTSNEYQLMYVNTATFQLPCGAMFTVDREKTKINHIPTTANKYQMVWEDIFPCELNGIPMDNPEMTPFDPEVFKLLFKDTTFSEFDFDAEIDDILEQDNDPDITVVNTEYIF